MPRLRQTRAAKAVKDAVPDRIRAPESLVPEN
jgi:hypothetical protein